MDKKRDPMDIVGVEGMLDDMVHELSSWPELGPETDGMRSALEALQTRIGELWPDVADEIWPGSKKSEQARYRVFEIDWSNDYMLIKSRTNKMDHTVDGIGQRLDGYRIFGYTDDSEWCVGAFLSTQPCSAGGNKKYAVGRLEPKEDQRRTK